MTILVKKISAFCKTGSGGTPSRSNKEFFENGTIPWVKSGELKNRYITEIEEYITDLAVKKSSAKLVSKGSLLIAMYGATVGEVSQLTFDATTNQAICNIQPDETVCDVNYLYRFLEASKPYLLSRRVGGGQPNISQGVIKDLDVLLPPLEEQRRIAAILDQADELRQKRQQAIEKLDQLLQATFIDMFGDPVSNPKGWEKETIGNLATFITSGSRGWAQYYTDSGSKFIRIQNLVKGDLDMSDCAYVNAPDSAEARRTLVQPGDVLLSITADLGRTAIVPDDIGLAHINQHIAILRLSGVNPAFASHYLASVGGKIQFEKLNRSAVKAGLNFDDIKSLEITLPPIELQDKYLKIVQAIKNYQKQLLQFKKQSDNLFQSLQNQVFSGNL